MAKKNIDGTISTGYWMFALFIILFPVLNLIAVPVLAIVSKNPSKRNFYKALIVFVLLVVIFHLLAIMVLGSPDFFLDMKDQIKKFNK